MGLQLPVQDIQSGPCNLRAIICFYFPSQTDMTNDYPYFNGYAFDMNTGSEGTSTGNTNSTIAGQAAAANLFPATAAACGKGVQFETFKIYFH